MEEKNENLVIGILLILIGVLFDGMNRVLSGNSTFVFLLAVVIIVLGVVYLLSWLSGGGP